MRTYGMTTMTTILIHTTNSKSALGKDPPTKPSVVRPQFPDRETQVRCVKPVFIFSNAVMSPINISVFFLAGRS